jgi:hypothetical protein
LDSNIYENVFMFTHKLHSKWYLQQIIKRKYTPNINSKVENEIN